MLEADVVEPEVPETGEVGVQLRDGRTEGWALPALGPLMNAQRRQVMPGACAPGITLSRHFGRTLRGRSGGTGEVLNRRCVALDVGEVLPT